jgi:Fe-S-cluster-containing dehydrogenase component
MERCAFCGAETQLYDGGIPICVKCCEERAKEETESDLPFWNPTVPPPSRFYENRFFEKKAS